MRSHARSHTPFAYLSLFFGQQKNTETNEKKERLKTLVCAAQWAFMLLRLILYTINLQKTVSTLRGFVGQIVRALSKESSFIVRIN